VLTNAEAATMSENTFEALLSPNLRSVQTLVQRRLRDSEDAEDLVQEIVLRAFQRRHQLRVQAKFRTWLWSIALNDIQTFFRRDRGNISLEEFPNLEAPVPMMPALARLERMERRAWVHACMAQLSQRDRADWRKCAIVEGMEQLRLGIWQISNMSFGFLGIP
jgi:RNA polymerase sigma factor (sigma-70 family)